MTFHELIVRFWEDLAARPNGPLALRFVLQPTVAIILAIRDGIADGRSEREPYLSTILRDPNQRAERLREGWRATTKVFGVAVALDVIYQLIELRAVHLLETVVVAFTLACLPYLLIRGPTARIARWRRSRSGSALD